MVVYPASGRGLSASLDPLCKPKERFESFAAMPFRSKDRLHVLPEDELPEQFEALHDPREGTDETVADPDHHLLALKAPWLANEIEDLLTRCLRKATHHCLEDNSSSFSPARDAHLLDNMVR